MQPYYSQMSSDERWEKVGELLYKAIHRLLLEEQQQNKNIQTKKYLNPQEAAQFLDVSHRTLQRWIARGQIPIHRKENGYIFFSQDDLEKIRVRKSKPVGKRITRAGNRSKSHQAMSVS